MFERRKSFRARQVGIAKLYVFSKNRRGVCRVDEVGVEDGIVDGFRRLVSVDGFVPVVY